VWKDTTTKLDRRHALVRRIALVLVVLVLVLAAYLYGRSQSLAGVSEEDLEGVALYVEALGAVRDDYVDQEALDPTEQSYGAIKGMIDSLGDEGHTRFMTPEEIEEHREGNAGRYVGIGVNIEEKDDEIVISSPMDGSPAEEAGLKSGDVLVAVDGQSVQNSMSRLCGGTLSSARMWPISGWHLFRRTAPRSSKVPSQRLGKPGRSASCWTFGTIRGDGWRRPRR
jgi:carboxyl-terminal processing protease